jgi:SAM-dependent methyltransferase
MTELLAPRPLRAAADLQTACKICGTRSPLYDVVDFHEDCHEADGRRMALSGIPVYYYRCPGCGFLFTRQFDDWDAVDFQRTAEIAGRSVLYHDQAEQRARRDLALLNGWFGPELSRLRTLVLGNGRLASLLREAGCLADFLIRTASGPGAPFGDHGRGYDLILAFDILEPAADPLATMRRIDHLVAPDGLLLLRTRLSDGDDPGAEAIRRRPLRFVSPRRGQLSIYNACSLALVLGTAGFRLAGARQGVHFGLRTLPAFAQHLFEDGPGWDRSRALSGLQ